MVFLWLVGQQAIFYYQVILVPSMSSQTQSSPNVNASSGRVQGDSNVISNKCKQEYKVIKRVHRVSLSCAKTEDFLKGEPQLGKPKTTLKLLDVSV